MAEPNQEGGISLWGDQFVARIDFTKALADSTRLDQNIRRAEQSLDRFVSNGTSRLAALAAGFDRVAASASRASGSMLGGGVGVIAGITGGAASVGRPPRTASQPPLMITPSIGPTPGFGWRRFPGEMADRFWGGIPINSQNQQILRSMGLLDSPLVPPFGGGGGFYNRSFPPGPPPPGAPPNWRFFGPAGALPAPGGAALVPFLTPQARTFMPMNRGSGSLGAFGRSYATGSRQLLGSLRGPAQVLTPRNLIAAASSIYVGQMFAGIARQFTNATIGEAMREQEARALLGNTLTSPQLGIDLDTANQFSNELVTARYLAGIPTSTASLGMSRTNLAEMYRMLAPLVRLTADDPADFRTGLQTGSLARQLLVARDPVQGTKGAMVALSELYAGGPDRFRSLSLRFELPRSRLLQIEKELEASGAYDPGEIAIRMLTEMGFGTSYLARRAEETLPGQLDRTGALFDNFRIDIFQGALTTVIGNFDRLNDAVEAWASSPAYDRAIARLDSFFAGIFNAVTTPLSNYISGSLMRGGGAMAPLSYGQAVTDFMRFSGGQFRNADGQVITPAAAFAEAAREVSSDHLEALFTAPRYNTGQAAASDAALGAVGILGGGLLVDRLLLGRGLSGAFGALSSGAGIRAAGMTALRGLASPAMLAAAVALAGGTAFGSIRSSGRSMQTLDLLTAAGFDTALPTGMFGGPLDSERMAGIAFRLSQGNRLQRFAGRSALGISAFGTSVGNLFGIAPAMGWWELQGAGQFIDDESRIAGATRGIRQAIFSGVENPASVTPQMAMRQGRALLEQARMADPVNFTYTPQEQARILQGLVQPGVDPNRYSAEALLAETINSRALFGRGFDLDPGAGLLGFTAEQSHSFLSPEAQAELQSTVMGRFEGNYGELRQILLDMLAETMAIGENTEGIDDTLTKATGLNRVQLSGAAGLFYGYDPNPDYRNVVPRHGVRPEAGSIRGALGLMGATAISSMPGQEYADGGPLAGHTHSGFDLLIGRRGVGGEGFLNPFTGGAEVVDKGFNSQGLGNYVHLRTQSGRIVRLGHFKQQVPWEVGERIPQGEVVGLEGSTGLSTGPHVHMDYLGESKANRDAELFREYFLEDTGAALPPGGQGGGPSAAAPVEVHLHIGSLTGTPEENAAAIRREFERMTRDGQLAKALTHVSHLNQRQKGVR